MDRKTSIVIGVVIALALVAFAVFKGGNLNTTGNTPSSQNAATAAKDIEEVSKAVDSTMGDLNTIDTELSELDKAVDTQEIDSLMKDVDAAK